MTIGGWLFLCGSWSAILALCVFCFWKIMTSTRENIHAPLDIDTDEHAAPGAAASQGDA